MLPMLPLTILMATFWRAVRGPRRGDAVLAIPASALAVGYVLLNAFPPAPT